MGHGDPARVQLIEIDPLHSESTQRALARRLEVRRAAVGIPPPALPNHAPLGRNHDTGAVAPPAEEGCGNKALVVPHVPLVEAVGVGGVDEGGAGVEGRAKHAERLLFRGASFDREVHPAIADGRDGRRAGAERSEDHPRTRA